MKTLKKTLCLVLAMVMVFGLCAVSASAKLDSYKDKDSITYAEAVDVLSGIGILKGDENGFRPKANITRAEAAKIIAYIVIGNATQADAVKASTDPFTDVPAGHWASGYIAYCATRGIVGGVGDGSYHPEEPVSGLAFAKMLLCALGYGQKSEYVGGDWAVKTASDAIRFGVFDDNMAGASEAYATREECALYAFNVVARIRDGQKGLKKVTWSQLAGDYVADGAFGGTSVDANKKSTFADDFGLGTADADPNAFGHPTEYHWTQKIGSTTKTITADYPDTTKDMTLFTAKVTGDDIYKLLGSKAKSMSTTATPNDNDELHVYIDGVPQNATSDKAKFIKGNDDTLFDTGNGVETYVYSWYDDDEDLHATICVVNTYMVQVRAVNEATSKKEANVEVKLLDNTITGISTGDTFDTDEFEKNDYVLITATKTGAVGGAKIQSMVPAVVIEDTITRYSENEKGSGKRIVVNGTTYTAAKISTAPASGETAASALDKTVVDGKDYKIYVDNYGYVIGVAKVKADSSYVYVSHFGDRVDTSGEFDESGVSAKIYYADGTNKVVPVDKVILAAGTKTSLSDIKACAPGIYKLVMKSGKAELTYDTAITDTVSGTNNPKQGRPSTVGGATTADDNTVFFYVAGAKDNNPTAADNEWNKSPFSVTVYTGIKNIPANKDNNCETVTIIKDDTKAAAVLVKDSGAGESTDIVYMYAGKHDVDKNDVTYTVYVNGEKDTLTITYTDDERNEKIGDWAGKVGKFFTVKGKTVADAVAGTEYDGSKYYFDLGKSGATTVLTALNKNEITWSGNGFALAENVKIIDITGADEPIEKVDKLVAAYDDSGIANFRIAIQVNKNAQVVAIYVVANAAS